MIGVYLCVFIVVGCFFVFGGVVLVVFIVDGCFLFFVLFWLGLLLFFGGWFDVVCFCSLVVFMYGVD